MATRGPQNIFSGEILPVPPQLDDPESDAFNRKLIDYLRRLTGKLARFVDTGGSGAVSSIALCFDSDQSDFSTGIMLLSWTNQLHKNAEVFEFSAPSTEITVLSAGTYVVEIDVRLLKNVQHLINVYVNGVRPNYGKIVLQSDVDASYSFMIPVVLSANDVITIELDASAFGQVYAYADGTRLLITRLGDTE